VVTTSALRFNNPVSASVSMRQVFSQLRQGQRPSLVGQIDGLTREMESRFFRTDFRLAKDWRSSSCPFEVSNIYGNICSVSPSDIGLSDDSPKIFSEWEKANSFPTGEAEEALHCFEAAIGSCNGISLSDAVAGRIYATIPLLKSMPQAMLTGETLSRITFEQNTANGTYSYNNAGIQFPHNFTGTTPYTYLPLAAHELGHSVDRILDVPLYTMSRELHKKARSLNAVFGTDFFGIPRQRVEYQNNLKEFFAENFMHFIILGEDGIKERLSGFPEIAADMCTMFRNIYSIPGFSKRLFGERELINIQAKGTQIDSGDAVFVDGFPIAVRQAFGDQSENFQYFLHWPDADKEHQTGLSFPVNGARIYAKRDGNGKISVSNNEETGMDIAFELLDGDRLFVSDLTQEKSSSIARAFRSFNRSDYEIDDD
jgi:hypothetical protein